jgi:putative sterol carrier protein
MADIEEFVARMTKAVSDKSPLGNKFAFDITGLGGVVIDGAGSANTVTAGAAEGDVVIGLEPGTLNELLSGSLNPMAAYTGGKLKIKGNLMLAQKLASLFK